MNRRWHPRGFTLMEVLIALAIFALLGAASARLLRDAVSQSQSLTDREAALAALVRTNFQLEQDIQQFSLRPVRDRFGDAVPALEVQGGALSLTRVGRRPALALESQSPALGSLQRIAWQEEGGKLTRRYWPVVDVLPDTEAAIVDYGLEVSAFVCEVLGTDGQRYSQWPVDAQRLASQAIAEDPPEAEALRCVLETAFWGPTLERFWRLPRGLPDLGRRPSPGPAPGNPGEAAP
jgi:general secretion pathway protein J